MTKGEFQVLLDIQARLTRIEDKLDRSNKPLYSKEELAEFAKRDAEFAATDIRLRKELKEIGRQVIDACYDKTQ